MQHVKVKRPILLALSVILGLAGTMLFIAAAGWALLDRFSEGFEASPQRLVYHTGHAAILRACKQVLADPQAAGFPKSTNGCSAVNGSQGGAQAPAALPAALRDLNFEVMVVEADRATIVFGGGFGHWGYRTTPAQGDSELQLIPGLWFWSEGKHLPRDLSKFPYYRTSKRLLFGGAVTFAVTIVLVTYRRRSDMFLNESRSAAS